MKALYEFILARLQEKSTWIAIVSTIATVFGATIAPEMQEAIVGTGLAVNTLALTIIKEK